MRLIAKSTPSKTGGLSSNRGSAWPGTNSTRSIRISIVDGATRTRTPCWWHWSTSSTASLWGKSASVISTSSMASKWRSSCSSERKSRRPSSRCDRRARDEPVGLDLARVAQGVRDGLDVRARPDQHRPPAVARGPQDHARHALEQPAERGHVQQREEQRPVEDVVRLERLALDLRVDEDDQRDLEQRGDHACEARPLGAVAVEARAREQQQHHQPAEREVVLRLTPHLAQLVGGDDRPSSAPAPCRWRGRGRSGRARRARPAGPAPGRCRSAARCAERAAGPRERRDRAGGRAVRPLAAL